MLPQSIRKLSYNPAVRGVVQHLRLGRFARRLYCRLLSTSGVLQLSCLGVEAVFKTHNSQQLAFVDCILTTERSAVEATLSSLAGGDMFLDVGSHYGIYSVLASKLVGATGQVIAVEPHPGALQILQENLAVNGCENVEVMKVAFSDKTGPLALSYNEHGSHRQRPSDSAPSIHAVQAIAGDEALRNYPVPTAVKIDVEGHEFAVLCGLKQTLSKPSCRLLCLEIHPNLLPPGVTQDSIAEFIRNCGFTVLSKSIRSTEVHIVAIRPSTGSHR
jgi:FkbM family methyltransferase